MTWEEYEAQVTKDALSFLEDCLYEGTMVGCLDTERREIHYPILEENLWEEDSVTGNGSGSYTKDVAKAMDNLKDAIWSWGFQMMVEDWEVDLNKAIRDPEELDVRVRCYLLSQLSHQIASAFAARNGWTVTGRHFA